MLRNVGDRPHYSFGFSPTCGNPDLPESNGLPETFAIEIEQQVHQLTIRAFTLAFENTADKQVLSDLILL